MLNNTDQDFFLENGYIVKENVIRGDKLKYLQEAFDVAYDKHKHTGRVSIQHLLKYKPFIDLMEDEDILNVHKTFFKNQIQLLAYDLLFQGPKSNFPERSWHRDFVFPGDHPLSINTILFVDDITMEKGPTRVLPKSHKGWEAPTNDKMRHPMEEEVAVEVPAGSAIYINSAIWHSGSRNDSEGSRRGIYLYYGYWWLKRYQLECKLPWEVLENASEQRLRLLGVKMPDHDLHMYDVNK